VTGTVLVDTNVLTARLPERSPLATRYAKHLFGQRIALAPQTVAEGRYGALKAMWGPARTEQLARLHGRARILPIDIGTIETPSVRGRDSASTLRSSALESLIPGDERGVSAERECAREVDGVVSAQFKLLGKLARLSGKRAIDPNQRQLTVQRLELLKRPTVRRRAQPPSATSGSERGTTLGITQDAGRCS
jgi:hypothetical protein